MRSVFTGASRFILAFLIAVPPAMAAGEFRTYNPDIGKYEFAVSYISALGYIHAVENRWKTTSPRKEFSGSDVTLMRGYVRYLIKDNADLRIAKNYLSKYLRSPNALVRKAADTFITACIKLIAINDKEKQIWDQWYAVKSNKLGDRTNERAFVKAQRELSTLRKEPYNAIVESSVLLVKVLKSDRNADERGRILAITRKQRGNLVKDLDIYGKDMLEWGMKPGQGHVQASVGVIREVLEDSIYTTLDESK